MNVEFVYFYESYVIYEEKKEVLTIVNQKILRKTLIRYCLTKKIISIGHLKLHSFQSMVRKGGKRSQGKSVPIHH